ncbi:hypothetical protein AGMMS50293_23340 [Spirochaetia bacterium]|nr:hypothetical protein AGMMS50293_23340 [Spirochaetia bacterium]
MNNMYRFGAAALLAISGFILPFSAGAAETSATAGANAGASAGVDFSIRFFDKRIYYVESDPVYVQITITNHSSSTYRFKLADERAFSVDFDIRSVTNRSLEQADALIRKRTQYQQIFFREIAVETGESFSFVEDLRDYVNLKQPGSFIVQARVFPELYRTTVSSSISANVGNTGGAAALESNRLNLNIRPPAIPGPDGIPLDMNVATNAVLIRERLAPDQVVEYMLSARQKSQWERFFLYLDLESMLARDGVRQRRWLAEGEEGRRRMLEDYRKELQSSVSDGDISVIPTEFTMQQTRYNNDEGTVVVLEKFRVGNFTELKRYTYNLEQKNNIWVIVNYSVVNLGTE